MRLRAERRVQKIVTATAIARNGMFAMASVLPRKAVSTTKAALTTRGQMTSGWARNRRDPPSANTPPPRALLSGSGMAGMGEENGQAAFGNAGGDSRHWAAAGFPKKDRISRMPGFNGRRFHFGAG